MNKKYFVGLRDKLLICHRLTWVDRLSKKPKKITLRMGNQKIAEFKVWEIQDLYYIWKEEAVQRYGLKTVQP